MSELQTSEVPAAEHGKTITVTVYFRLSLEGQKAAVLAGKPAARDQEITGEVSADLLPLCEITPEGKVVAKLRERINIGKDGTIGGAAWSAFHPELDAPLDSAQAILVHVRDGLAAEVSEVKSAYAKQQAEEETGNQKRRAEFEASMAKAQAELDADPKAIPSGIYMPTGWNYYTWRDGDHPVAVEIRRRQKAAEEAEKRAAAEAAAAKQQFIRTFLVEHGTPDQVERFDAGLLSEKEYLDAMADIAFVALADVPRYQKLTREDVYNALDVEQSELVDGEELKVQFDTEDAKEATAEEWASLKRIQALVPEAHCKLRLHDSTFDHKSIPWGIATRKGIQVKLEYGPFTFVREYAA